MAVLSQPGSEQRNLLSPRPLSAQNQGCPATGFACCLDLPQTHHLYCSELTPLPRPGAATHAGSRPPAAVQTARSAHDLSIWHFVATVLGVACGSGGCETVRGIAWCWDLRAAADGTGSRSDSIDAAECFLHQSLRSRWDARSQEPPREEEPCSHCSRRSGSAVRVSFFP